MQDFLPVFENFWKKTNKCMNNKLGTLIFFFSRNPYLQKASYGIHICVKFFLDY